jgi:hypothetical protein
VSVLRREPGWSFSEIAPEWGEATAVLFGGGPSLTVEQVEQVRTAREAGKVRVIAINDAYRLAPFADVCYFADSEWWGWHKDRPEFRAFAGQKCSIADSGANITDKEVHILLNANGRGHSFGLSLDPKQIVTGRNSGYQALNIAILAGAKTILLLGFDAREPTATSKSHWFGDHPRIEPVAAYAEYRKAFSAGESAIDAAGVRVLNCSPGSAIDSFPKMDLTEALRYATVPA